jgi:hypothetical protein
MVIPAFLATRAHAELLTFHVDPAQSYMTFAVDATDGTPLTSAQTPGSDTTALFGTFAADLTSSTLQFINSADIHEALQAVNQSPLPGGSPGTAPAQFGLTAFVQDVVNGTAAARDLLAEAGSAVLPLSGTSFDSTKVQLTFLTGSVDYNLDVLGSNYAGNASVVSYAYSKTDGGTVSVTGNVATITMPYYTTGYFSVDNIQLTPIFAGQIVATAVIPEPAGVITALLGAISIALFWRWQRAKHA